MKKLNFLSISKKLKEKNVKIFTTLDFQRVFGIDYQRAKKIIYRYTKNKIFTKAKKGLYFLTLESPSDFELANRLYQPSYISFETALSFYGIIPETIYEVISATPKISREFIVNNLKFSYKKIKKECFLGYVPIKIKGELVLIAEPEKALADFFYFVTLKKRLLSYERIDLKKIKRQRLIEYAKCFQDERLLKLVKNLYD